MVERYAFRYVFVLIFALMGRPHPITPSVHLGARRSISFVKFVHCWGFSSAFLLFCCCFVQEESLRIKKKLNASRLYMAQSAVECLEAGLRERATGLECRSVFGKVVC